MYNFHYAKLNAKRFSEFDDELCVRLSFDYTMGVHVLMNNKMQIVPLILFIYGILSNGRIFLRSVQFMRPHLKYRNENGSALRKCTARVRIRFN